MNDAFSPQVLYLQVLLIVVYPMLIVRAQEDSLAMMS